MQAGDKRRLHRAAIMVLSAGCVVSLVACYPPSGSVEHPPQEVQIPACVGIESLAVEDLVDPTRFADCEPLNVPVRFPDGFTLSIDEFTGTTSSQSVSGVGGKSPEYSLFRVGIFGLVASMQEPGEPVRRWGTPIGVCLVSGAEDENRQMTSADCR